MNISHLMAAAAAATVASSAAAFPVTVFVDQDYMSSGFFFSDFLRGESSTNPSDTVRAANRATSPVIFGVTGETSYFNFGFDPSQFSGPIDSAVFRVETVANGFFPDPTPSSPAEVSLHRLSADPLAVVDQSLESGPGSWLDFRDSEITMSSIVSTTTVDGLGVFEWDVTSIVNEWIANGDANFAYSLGSSAILDPEGDAAVGFVNSSWVGLTDEVTARIVIIPSPGVLTLTALCVAGVSTRRRR